MHVVVFRIKRAFQATVRVTRPLFCSLEVTPARVDMLLSIGDVGCWQRELRRSLGVSAATVSRMLGALERSGLVRRERGKRDTRQRFVSLTDRGRALRRRAHRLLVSSGTVERLLLDVLAPKRESKLVRRLKAFDGMDGPLMDIARGFGDTGSPPYPGWHPDD
jgi:DNA-binding MarR family transcriptional regulator